MNAPRVAEGVERGDELLRHRPGLPHLTGRRGRSWGATGIVAKLYDSGVLGVDIWAAGYVDGKTWSSMTSPTRSSTRCWPSSRWAASARTTGWVKTTAPPQAATPPTSTSSSSTAGGADQVPVQQSPRQGRARKVGGGPCPCSIVRNNDRVPLLLVGSAMNKGNRSHC